MAMCLKMAMFSGPKPVRKRARSSWKTTSMTQCSRFSMPQWARTAREGRGVEGYRGQIEAAREGGLAAPPHLGLDHGGEVWKAGLSGKTAIGREPSHVVADEVTPDLDAAVVAVGGGVAIEAVGWSLEEALDLAVQVRPVGFHRDEV